MNDIVLPVPEAYGVIKEDLQTRFFSTYSGYTWIPDRHSDNFLLIHGEANKIGVLEPNGSFELKVTKENLLNDYFVESVMRNVGIVNAQLVRTTNTEPYFELTMVGGKKIQVRADDTIVGYGTRRAGLYEGTPDNLQLDFVPATPAPQALAKVPRAIIAQLREHVEKHYKLAKIQRKLVGNTFNRWQLGSDPNVTPEMLAAIRVDVKGRGRFMTSNDSTFWKWITLYYASPASLIDSCRGEFYDAAGVRGADKNTVLNLQPVTAEEEAAINAEPAEATDTV